MGNPQSDDVTSYISFMRVRCQVNMDAADPYQLIRHTFLKRLLT